LLQWVRSLLMISAWTPQRLKGSFTTVSWPQMALSDIGRYAKLSGLLTSKGLSFSHHKSYLPPLLVLKVIICIY
jgi:hypothetical protein